MISCIMLCFVCLSLALSGAEASILGAGVVYGVIDLSLRVLRSIPVKNEFEKRYYEKEIAFLEQARQKDLENESQRKELLEEVEKKKKEMEKETGQLYG